MTYKAISTGSRGAFLADYPLECPECHHKTTPNFIFHKVSSNGAVITDMYYC